jgi:hypothetical protein
LQNRPGRGFARVNLIWVIGLAAGIFAGGIVAYGVMSSSAGTTASR